MGKKWIIPVMILGVLITAMVFRFNVEATKTGDYGVVKWERDRWTGHLWMKRYTFSTTHGYFEMTCLSVKQQSNETEVNKDTTPNETEVKNNTTPKSGIITYEELFPQYDEEIQIKEDQLQTEAMQLRNRLTLIWLGLMALDLIWLAVIFTTSRKKDLPSSSPSRAL